jgi:hypothetical protein
VMAAAAVAVAFVPWLGYVRGLRRALYADDQMDWMPLPRLEDLLAFLGREPFWGLAGAEVRWGPAVTSLLAVLALILLVLQWWRQRGGEPGPAAVGSAVGLGYAAWLLAAPVALAAAASYLYRPVFLPERFAMLVLTPFVILLAAACVGQRRPALSVLLAVAVAGTMLAGTVVQARTTLKTDWRGLAREWPRDRSPARLVCFPPYIAYCVGHYLGEPRAAVDRDAVERALPELVGEELWVVAAADYPFAARPADARAYRWLLGLGRRQTRALAAAWRLDRVTVGVR